MTLMSKNVYIKKIDEIGNKYKNTYHRTNKTKPVGVKSKTYINSSNETNDKDPKYKNILAKAMFQIGLKIFLL